MDRRLTFRYDRAADTLYFDVVPPYAGQECEELGDCVIARLNPDSGAIETLEVMALSSLLEQGELLDLPTHVLQGARIDGSGSRVFILPNQVCRRGMGAGRKTVPCLEPMPGI